MIAANGGGGGAYAFGGRGRRNSQRHPGARGRAGRVGRRRGQRRAERGRRQRTGGHCRRLRDGADERRRRRSGLEDAFALASQLIEARSRAGLTQAEVAERMGTSQSTAARLESGGAKPSLSTLKRFAKATGARALGSRWSRSLGRRDIGTHGPREVGILLPLSDAPAIATRASSHLKGRRVV
jgi:transcriptional regulator with XRE-family HTH domain